MFNGGIIGDISTTSLTSAKGVWGSRDQYLASKNGIWPKTPDTVFVDTFETFTGWVTQGSGIVTQSSAQAYEGSFSALKSTAGDPNGAYKLLDITVNRDYLLDVWIYSVEPRAGGAADRISIVNSTGNGYGLFFNATAINIERRDAYGAFVISTTSWTRTGNSWYRATFQAFTNNTFTLTARDITGTVLGSITSTVDSTYAGPFDRVAILGGSDYHVDNLVIKKNL